MCLWGFITTQLTLSATDSFSGKPVAEKGSSRNSWGLQAFANLQKLEKESKKEKACSPSLGRNAVLFLSTALYS